MPIRGGKTGDERGFAFTGNVDLELDDVAFTGFKGVALLELIGRRPLRVRRNASCRFEIERIDLSASRRLTSYRPAIADPQIALDQGDGEKAGVVVNIPFLPFSGRALTRDR
jgi:hypothetical protein